MITKYVYLIFGAHDFKALYAVGPIVLSASLEDNHQEKHRLHAILFGIVLIVGFAIFSIGAICTSWRLKIGDPRGLNSSSKLVSLRVYQR